jgi:HK97 family phage portal protein
MNRLTLFDGATIKSKDLSMWSAEEWHSVFGAYFGSDEQTPRRLYGAVGWLYACVNLRADRVASMPWAIFQGKRQVLSDEEELSAYPFMDNFGELLELTEAALCLCGYAYWFKARNARNMPLGLRWFAPDSVEPLYDAEVGIRAFRRFITGHVGGAPSSAANTLYTPDDIIYFRLPNALSELEPGIPPVQAACADAAVLDHMNDFAGAFFARGAIKATVLSVDPETMDDQLQKIEAWWKRFFSGVKKAWSSAAIRGKLEAVVVGEGLESLTNNDLTLERRQSIATALGVPHSIVAADAANYATAQQDEINFLTNCIIPESRLIQRTLNRQLFAPVGLRLEFQPERLSAMQEDEEQRAAAYSLYVNAKVKPSIAAQLVGLNLPDGVTPEMLDEPLAQEQELQRQQNEAQMARRQPPQPAQLPAPSGYEEHQREQEVRRLQRWAKGKKEPDVDRFASRILTREQKVAALVEIDMVPSVMVARDLWGEREDAGADDAPFPLPYP